MNEEKGGGGGDDSHTSGSCFPEELIITTLSRFAGARQRVQQHENHEKNNTAMFQGLENAATAAWVKGSRPAKNRL